MLEQYSEYYSQSADTTIGVVTGAIGLWTFLTNLLIIFAFLQQKVLPSKDLKGLPIVPKTPCSAHSFSKK